MLLDAHRGRAVAAAIAALTLAAAASTGLASGAEPPPETSAVPIPADRVDAAVAQLDGIAADMMARTGVPGMSIAVVHDDAVVYAKGFGVRSVQTREPVDESTVFQLASLSKPLGATVVARTVGRTKLRWDDRMRRRLPWFALSRRTSTRELTIADLYSHRSGLPDHAGDLLEDLGFGRGRILRRLRHQPVTPIRTEYAYTNFGLTAAGVAVARAAGTSWARLSERQLYRPLGMRSTSSRHADYLRAPNRSVLHVREGGRWVARHDRDPDAQSPAGGVSSTAADMARWLRLQLAEGVLDGRRIVAPGPLATMRAPHILSGRPATPSSRPSFYGLGIGVGDDWTGRVRYSHSGAFALGAATNVVMLPSEDLGIVVLTNGQPVGLAESVSATFIDLVEMGRPERDWLTAYTPLFDAMDANHSRLAGRARPTDPRPARPARVYAGTYANRYFGRLRVRRRGGRLTMLLGPRPQAFRLRHWSGDTFSYMPRGENAVGISAVTFHPRKRGRGIRAVTVEHLDESGLGRFPRRSP